MLSLSATSSPLVGDAEYAGGVREFQLQSFKQSAAAHEV